jgi:rhamnogalacturonyl hydrolase YesR
MTRRTHGALARVVQAQMHHLDVQRRWRMRWLKRAQIHLPLFSRLQTNPVDLHDWYHGMLYQGLVAFSRRTGEDAPADLVATIGRENHSSDGQLPTDLARPEMGGETSATALLVFAVTHGINSGLLERQRWQAPILFSREHLLTRVKASGELADVQPPGEAPGPSHHHLSLQPFAAGLVLMAGEEVLTLLVSPPRTRPKAC